MKFLWWEVHVSTALISLGSFLVGIILGFIIAKINQFTKERKNKVVKKTKEKREVKQAWQP